MSHTVSSFAALRRAVALVAVAVVCLSVSAKGPELTWDVDFRSVFDNREGDDTYTAADTYFFTRLAPEVGLKFTSHDRIAGGLVWTQPIGYDWNGNLVVPTVYYAREGRWGGAVGLFPKTLLHEPLPNFLESDSLNYFQRNIRGLLLQYNGRTGFAEMYIDWRQRRTETKREAFDIVFHGRWNPGVGRFFVGGYAMMNHYALTRNAGEDQHIVDNFLINPYVGVDLSHATALDSLVIRAGGLLTVERNRAYSDWQTPGGGWLDIAARWRWLELKNTFYAGGKLFPSYAEHGSQLYLGEPYYSSDLFNRTDITAHIISSRYVDLGISVKFNVTPDAFMFYQCVDLRVNLGSGNFKADKQH